MGVFGFLKKKQELSSSGLVPIDKSNEDIEMKISGSSQGIPPMQNIPRPPSPAIQNNDDIMPPLNPRDDIQTDANFDTIPVPPSDIPSEPETMENEPISSTDRPIQQEQQEPAETPDELGEDEFILPEFTEDDLKVGEELEKLEHEASEKKKEEQKEDFSKDPDEPPVEKEDVKKKKTQKSDDVKAEPVVKPAIEEPFAEHYISVAKCFDIFDKLGLNQAFMRDMTDKIIVEDARAKSEMQIYRNFHDYLDVSQEKLMQIETLFFER